MTSHPLMLGFRLRSQLCATVFFDFLGRDLEITISVEVHVVLNGEDHNKTQVFWIAVPEGYEKQSPHKYNNNSC